MAKKIKRSGGKFTRSHSSAIPAAEELLDLLQKITEVKKISLGVIKAGKPSGGKRFLKIKERRGGFLITVRGNNSIQEIGVYTKRAGEVIELLKDKAFKYAVEVVDSDRIQT